MEFLRPATAADASRIAEIIVTNYRTNFYPFFRNDAFYFGKLNVVDMASEYTEDTQQLRNTYVYDDGIVESFAFPAMQLKSYMWNRSFKGSGLAHTCWILRFVKSRRNGSGYWNTIQGQLLFISGMDFS